MLTEKVAEHGATTKLQNASERGESEEKKPAQMTRPASIDMDIAYFIPPYFGITMLGSALCVGRFVPHFSPSFDF